MGFSLWDVGFSSLTRDRTQAPCTGSTESQPLDHQGSPHSPIFSSVFVLPNHTFHMVQKTPFPLDIYFPMCHYNFSKVSLKSQQWPFLWKLSAAAAKLLQLCPTLCDPIDGNPPGSPVPGILQARIPEWVAISFSNAWKWKVKVKSLSRVRLLATPRTAAYQAHITYPLDIFHTYINIHIYNSFPII